MMDQHRFKSDTWFSREQLLSCQRRTLRKRSTGFTGLSFLPRELLRTILHKTTTSWYRENQEGRGAEGRAPRGGCAILILARFKTRRRKPWAAGSDPGAGAGVGPEAFQVLSHRDYSRILWTAWKRQVAIHQLRNFVGIVKACSRFTCTTLSSGDLSCEPWMNPGKYERESVKLIRSEMIYLFWCGCQTENHGPICTAVRARRLSSLG